METPMSSSRTSHQVKLMIAEAQLYAAQMAMFQAHRDYERGVITNVERGRLLAKQTRLEAKVWHLQYAVREAA
jgi:hypothetical protein